MLDATAANESQSTAPRPRPSIIVRHPQIDLSSRSVFSKTDRAAIPRFWWGGDPFKTHFLDALSSTFPFGEAFFVRSVRFYANRIDDPDLREQIRLFSGQEGQHNRLHDKHVNLLLDHGYTALATRNRMVDRFLRWQNRRAPALCLALTASLEHLTAILGRQVLEDPNGWLEDMDPEMARLWRWHALEEAEHKAVAFDVLMQVAPSRLRRNFAMALNTGGLVLEVVERMIYMFWKDGFLFSGSTWAQGLRFLFGRGGFLRGRGDEYLAWYRRDFHPDVVDDHEMIARNAPLIEVVGEPTNADRMPN